MAGDGQHKIMMLRIHQLDIGAQRFPELRQAREQRRICIGGRRDDAPAVADQVGKARIRSRIFRAGHRMSGNDRMVRQHLGQRLPHGLLAGADIADQRAGGQDSRDPGSSLSHGAGRHAEDDQLRVADGFCRRIANPVNQCALDSAPARRGIEVIAGGDGARQELAHGQPDGAAQQAKADDGDAFKAHRAASHISRSPAAMASICPAVPIVMRSPCGRPCPGSQRVM